MQPLFNPPPCASTGKRGGTVSYLTPQSKCVASLISLLTFLFFPALAAAHTVNLSWDASTSPNIVGYNIYRGANANGPYTKINSSLDPNTNYSDTTVQSGETYYYVTTAVDNQGVESAYSNQSEAMIPGGGSGSENVVYNFAGGSDPKLPYAGLIFDKSGNLYGTTELGGTNNQGTVFEITPNSNGSWTETVLYNFTGSTDGGQPYGSLVFDAAGNLYGTTNFGGSANCNMGCGTVFKLTPRIRGWTESVLYTFTGGSDGREPYARLLFDAGGNLYGTTLLGGNIGSVCSEGCGTVFKLTPGSSGWTESVLYAFQGAADGASPYDGLAFDAARKSLRHGLRRGRFRRRCHLQAVARIQRMDGERPSCLQGRVGRKISLRRSDPRCHRQSLRHRVPGWCGIRRCLRIDAEHERSLDREGTPHLR